MNSQTSTHENTDADADAHLSGRPVFGAKHHVERRNQLEATPPRGGSRSTAGRGRRCEESKSGALIGLQTTLERIPSDQLWQEYEHSKYLGRRGRHRTPSMEGIARAR